MKKTFTEPEFEVILLDSEDVLTESPGSNYSCSSGAYGTEEEIDWDS